MLDFRRRRSTTSLSGQPRDQGRRDGGTPERGRRPSRAHPADPEHVSQGDVGYNGLDGGPGINLQLTINPPVWHKNQGNIYQAQTDLVRGRERVRRIALELEKRLADELAVYHTALDITRTFRNESIPRARKAYELLLESYRRRRATWPEVLVAQRLWFEVQSEYILALLDLRMPRC